MIVDSTIWNNKWEADLLWLKLYHETEVDHFYINQNEFDYHGNFKGDTLSEVLKEERFEPFLGRITTTLISKKFGDPSESSNIDPQNYATAEWELREASTNLILNKYDDDTIILNTDVDEFFDFVDEQRKANILNELQFDGPIQFDRVRFIYAVDNIAQREKFDMITPAYRVKHIKNGVCKLRDKKWIGKQVANPKRINIFEYCHLMSYEGYISKHMSSLHTLWNEDKLKDALKWNTWPKTSYEGLPDTNCRWHWFEKIELNEDNSPEFIRENQDKLPNLVNPNYIEERIKQFGFNPVHTANGNGNYDI